MKELRKKNEELEREREEGEKERERMKRCIDQLLAKLHQAHVRTRVWYMQLGPGKTEPRHRSDTRHSLKSCPVSEKLSSL